MIQAHSSCTLQMFFAYRVFLLSRNWLIPAIAWLSSSIRFGWAVVCAVYLRKSGSVSQFSVDYGWMLDVLLSLHVAVDTLISGATFATLSEKQPGFGV